MRKLLLALAVLATAVGSVLYTAPAHAQATRTWVSGVGDDANPCSRTAPCKTWAGAISKTAAGGEIDALDPGGFGTVTITKSITLDGAGQVASALAAGTPGMTISAASNDVVTIRNIKFQGILGNGSSPSGAGTVGINFIAGAQLIIDRCDIMGFNSNGISATVQSGATSRLYVTNTTVTNTGTATSGTGSAIIVNGSGGTLNATLNNVQVFRGSNGGLVVINGATVMANNTVIAGVGTGLDIEGGGTLDFNNGVVDHNTTGVFNSGSTVRLSNSDVTFNGTGVSGTVSSFSNNRFQGNGGGGTITPIGSTSNPTGQQ